jgi:hypothetical protein
VGCCALLITAIDVFYWFFPAEMNLMDNMSSKPVKRYLFASDFDQTLTFNDSGYVLSELVGIPTEEFERKAKGMAKLNLVQQGAELAYLLLHDPEFQQPGAQRSISMRSVSKFASKRILNCFIGT